MKSENEKSANGAEADNGEAALPLFSAFRPKPRPAHHPPAAPAPRPPTPEKAPSAVQLEPRLAELEKKLQESEQRTASVTTLLLARLTELEKRLRESADRENARAPEKGTLDRLNDKVGELENKLRDYQEKGLASVYELKGKEEARKESRRELEEVLAALKRQQSATEAERLQTAELKYDGRIEALEQRLAEISCRPPTPPPADLYARIEELAGKLETVSARLDAAKKIEKSPDNAVIALEIETRVINALDRKLDARLKREFSALEKSKVDFMGNAVTNMSHLLSGRLGEIREAIHYLSSDAAAAGIEAERTVEWLRGFMDRKGREAAENIAGSYDLGFIQASLDNLEKCLSSAINDLDRAWEDAQEACSLPAMTPELRASRHGEALRSAIDSLKDNLDAFRDIRPGLVNNIRKNLTGG